jgi:H/ACA ribonucleoprotein complex subunit 4
MLLMPETTPPWEIERKLLVKAEAKTSPRYGCRPEERPIEEYIRFGLINLDKPPGPSSHEVAAWIKRLLDIEKVGHGGTLDPKVTGILPIALLDATKVIQALLQSGKEYICITKLHAKIPENRIKTILEEFTGTIYQRPPLRASVKRRLRKRRIYRLELLDARVQDRNILFRVACEAGTYIRKLAHDIGEALGCGAHMRELRRVRSGPFAEDDSLVTLHDVAYQYAEWKETGDEGKMRRLVQPMEKALEYMPKATVRDSAVDSICHGANIAAPGVLSLETGIEPETPLAIFTQKGEAVALAKALASTEQIMRMDHGIVAATQRVFMSRGIYPKMWRGKHA